MSRFGDSPALTRVDSSRWLLSPSSLLVRLAPSLAALAALALVAIYVVISTPDAIVQDTWLALTSGREIVQHGLPHVDHLTILGAGRHWIDQQWLGQLILYGLAAAGGMTAVAVAGMTAALCAWAIALAAASRAGTPSPTLITLLTVAGLASGPWALQIRTQELALPLFALVLALLLRDPTLERRRTFLVLPLLVLWANVHGSVVLGVAVAVAYAVTICLASRPRVSALRRAWPYLLLPPAALLASPYGLSLVHYYRVMLIDPPFRHLVDEWQATLPGRHTAIFFALAAFTALVAVRSIRRFQPAELVVLALTFSLALAAARNIVWFALAVLAVVPARVGKPHHGFHTRAAGSAAVVMGAVVLAVLISALAKPPSYFQGRMGPAAAAAVGRSLEQTGGPVFADDTHADWLLWTFPVARGRIVYDDRLEILTRPQVKLLAATLSGSDPSLLRRSSLFVLDPARARQVERLRPSRVVYADAASAVLVGSG